MKFEFLTSTNLSYEFILWTIFAGIVLAALYTFIYRKILGPFVDHLLSEKATSEDRAIPFADTKFASNKAVCFLLRHRGTYRKVIAAKAIKTADGASKESKKRKADPNDLAFYLPDIDKARSIGYDSDTKALYFLLGLIGTALVILAFIKLVPVMEELIRVLGEYAEEIKK